MNYDTWKSTESDMGERRPAGPLAPRYCGVCRERIDGAFTDVEIDRHTLLAHPSCAAAIEASRHLEVA